MLKRIALLTRKPGMTPEQFRRHWNEVHGPLIARHPNVVRYVQDNVLHRERFVDRNPDPQNPLPPDYQGPPADGIVELWFESREKMDELYASDLAPLLREDALKHIGTITTFVVEERTVVDRRPPSEAAATAPRGLTLSLEGQRGLARAGATVVATDLQADTARATAQAEGLRMLDRVLDVTDRSACVELAERLHKEMGGITLLVNNAGITVPCTLGAADAPHAWDEIWSVNASGMFNVTQAFVAQIKQARGAILNISSVAERAARGGNTAYQSSKAAVTQMTRGWAVELAHAGVRVNAAVFLLSPLAGYITGTVLPVDGGFDAS